MANRQLQCTVIDAMTKAGQKVQCDRATQCPDLLVSLNRPLGQDHGILLAVDQMDLSASRRLPYRLGKAACHGNDFEYDNHLPKLCRPF
jgi:hypothetical protein